MESNGKKLLLDESSLKEYRSDPKKLLEWLSLEIEVQGSVIANPSQMNEADRAELDAIAQVISEVANITRKHYSNDLGKLSLKNFIESIEKESSQIDSLMKKAEEK